LQPARQVNGVGRRERSTIVRVRSKKTNPLVLRLTGKSRLAYNHVMADVFEALSTPARRAILDELHERDGQTLFELCGRLVMKHGMGLTRQAISQHLDVLESAELLTTRREGRYKFHYLNTAPLKTIVERWLKKPAGRKGADQ
jgi:DNA-binding transcriptional ArsR family regulator